MRTILLVIIISASLLSCDRKQEESPSVAFEQDIVSLKGYFHIPGMAAIITRHGEIIYEDYFGYADLTTKRLVDSSTVFPISSITKTYATVLLMQLVEAGQVDLNEPMDNYVEDSDLPDSVTVRHVLSHTSEGIPGSFFNYMGWRFELLTDVVEEVSGSPIAALMNDRILRPHGLDDTFPIVNRASLDSLRDDLAKPYYYYGTTEDGRYEVVMNTAIGLASTVRDVAKFDDALQSGELISDRSKTTMFSPYRTSTGISPYGLGIFSQTFLGKNIIWGYGQEDCFSSLILKVPEDDITLVLLANNNLMSDPAKLINGDVTYSLFALSFLKHFVLDVPQKFDWADLDDGEGLDATLIQSDHGAFYRQELLANASAALFAYALFAYSDSSGLERSRALTEVALEEFPDYENYGNVSLLRLLTDLSTVTEFGEFDNAVERLGEKLLEKNPLDPYVNESLGRHYSHLNQEEEALEYYERIAEADNFYPFWYTIRALDFLGEYYKRRNPELAKHYFQRVVEIDWNIGGLLDKAKMELEEL